MRYRLIAGIVGDYDGAYDSVPEKEYDHPDNSIGYHEGTWPDWGWTIIETTNEDYVATLEAVVATARRIRNTFPSYREWTNEEVDLVEALEALDTESTNG